jgi:hypothetical protein
MFIQTFFLKMTDTMISPNIDRSSWDTLYIVDDRMGKCMNFVHAEMTFRNIRRLSRIRSGNVIRVRCCQQQIGRVTPGMSVFLSPVSRLRHRNYMCVG